MPELCSGLSEAHVQKGPGGTNLPLPLGDQIKSQFHLKWQALWERIQASTLPLWGEPCTSCCALWSKAERQLCLNVAPLPVRTHQQWCQESPLGLWQPCLRRGYVTPLSQVRTSSGASHGGPSLLCSACSPSLSPHHTPAPCCCLYTVSPSPLPRLQQPVPTRSPSAGILGKGVQGPPVPVSLRSVCQAAAAFCSEPLKPPFCPL